MDFNLWVNSHSKICIHILFFLSTVDFSIVRQSDIHFNFFWHFLAVLLSYLQHGCLNHIMHTTAFPPDQKLLTDRTQAILHLALAWLLTRNHLINELCTNVQCFPARLKICNLWNRKIVGKSCLWTLEALFVPCSDMLSLLILVFCVLSITRTYDDVQIMLYKWLFSDPLKDCSVKIASIPGTEGVCAGHRESEKNPSR